MKYIKLFLLLAVAAFGFASCSDDEAGTNSTSGTTVSLPTDTIKVKENAGVTRIPVTVTGARNGDVKITVSFTPTGANPAIADSNYYATSNTAVISADSVSSEGFIEFEPVDDNEINENREFTVTITSAEGATIGNASTVVVLRDNDSEFYDKLQGKWTMTATRTSGASVSWDVTISGASDESDADYNKTLYISGMVGYDWTYAELSYNFDITTKEGYVSFDNLGSYVFASGVGFTGIGDNCTVILYTQDDEGYFNTSPAIVGNWNSDFTEITFPEDRVLWGAIFDSSYNYTGFVWFGIYNIKLTRSN